MLNLINTLPLLAFPIFLKANSLGSPSSACEIDWMDQARNSGKTSTLTSRENQILNLEKSQNIVKNPLNSKDFRFFRQFNPLQPCQP